MKISKKSIIHILIIAAVCSIISFLLYNLTILSKLEKDILFTCLCIVFVAATMGALYQKTILLRLMVTIVMLSQFFVLLFYILDIFGFWESISTFENLRAFIKDFGLYSSLVFLAIQILQVVAIPIPGVITVSVGNIVFGFVWGSLLSYAGIIIGSVLAFLIGRKFGYKLVVWIVGEDNLNKVLNMIKGKDKIMFTMIFLLPFFPDDILCFVAGLTPMSLFFFISMALATRIITIAATAAFTEFVKFLIGSGTIYGYAALTLIAAFLLLIFYYTIKHGEKIQTYFEQKYYKLFKKNRIKKEDAVNSKAD